MTFSISQLGYLKEWSFDGFPRGYSIGFRASANPVDGVSSRAVFELDNLVAGTADVYLFDYAPLTDDGVVYDDPIPPELIRTQAVHVKEFFQGARDLFYSVSVTNTAITLSGEHNLHAYFFSFGDRKTLLYSSSSFEEMLDGMPSDLTLDLYVPDILLAYGFGYDYAWNLKPGEKGVDPGYTPPPDEEPPTDEDPPPLIALEDQQFISSSIELTTRRKKAIVLPTGQDSAVFSEASITDSLLYEALVTLGAYYVEKTGPNTYKIYFRARESEVQSGLTELSALDVTLELAQKIEIGIEAAYFSPNGDGIDDVLQVPVLYALESTQGIAAVRADNVEVWLEINGFVSRKFGPSEYYSFSNRITLPKALRKIAGLAYATWDGLRPDGTFLEEGLYAVDLTVELKVGVNAGRTIATTNKLINVTGSELNAAAKQIVGREGGYFEVTEPTSPAYGAGILIPAGVLDEPLYFSISTSSTHGEEFVPLDGMVGGPISFEPSMEFAGPVTLVIPYDSSITYERRYRESDLDLQTLVGENWVPTGNSTVDYLNDTIYAEVMHFSRYVASGSLLSYGQVIANLRSDIERTARSAYYDTPNQLLRGSPETYVSNVYASYYLSGISTYYTQYAYRGALGVTSLCGALGCLNSLDELAVLGIDVALKLIAFEGLNYHYNAGYTEDELAVKLTKSGSLPVTSKDFTPSPSLYPRGWSVGKSKSKVIYNDGKNYPYWTMQMWSTGMATNALADFAQAWATYVAKTESGRSRVIQTVASPLPPVPGPFYDLDMKIIKLDRQDDTACFTVSAPAPDCFVDLATLTHAEMLELVLGYLRRIHHYWLSHKITTGYGHGGEEFSYMPYSNHRDDRRGDNYAEERTALVNVVNTTNHYGVALAKYGLLMPEQAYNGEKFIDVAKDFAREFRRHWGTCNNYSATVMGFDYKAKSWRYGHVHDPQYVSYNPPGDDVGHANFSISIVSFSSGWSTWSREKWGIFTLTDLNHLRSGYLSFLTTVNPYGDRISRYRWDFYTDSKNVTGCYQHQTQTNWWNTEDSKVSGEWLSSGIYANTAWWSMLGYWEPDIWEVNGKWLEKWIKQDADADLTRGPGATEIYGMTGLVVPMQFYYDVHIFNNQFIGTLVSAILTCLITVGIYCPLEEVAAQCSLGPAATADMVPLLFVFAYLYWRRRR